MATRQVHQSRASSGGTAGYRSIRAASGELGLSELTIRRAITAGEIPAVQIHGQWRIPLSYFEDLERQAYSRCTPASWLSAPHPRPRRRTKGGVAWSESAGDSALTVLRPDRGAIGMTPGAD